MKKTFHAATPPVNPASDADGYILVTVLVFTAVLMATMAIIMNGTLMETIMSGAGTASKKSLSAADAGVEYVRGAFILVNEGGYPDKSSSGNYTTTVRNNSPSPLNTEITFVNISSVGADNSILVGKGFSGRYVSSNSGGNSVTLSAYRSVITSTAKVTRYAKTIEFQGYNLAP